jgi:ribosome maturation factor RimP
MMISTPFIEVYMNIAGIKEKLSKILIPKGLEIYSVKTKKEFGNKILEILIDVDVMDINDLEKIHLELVDQLSDDDLDDDFYLELSSLGAERPLNTRNEVKNALTKYVYLESVLYKGFGYLNDFKEDIITLEVNVKGRIKTIEIPFDGIKNMRLAIKF